MSATKLLNLPELVVLVLEVDGPEMIMACSLLEDEGVRVREAYDESDALAILDRQRIDFALLAVKLLYGKDSLSVAAIVAERSIPFIWTYGRQNEQRRIPAQFRDRPAVKKPMSGPALHESRRAGAWWTCRVRSRRAILDKAFGLARPGFLRPEVTLH